VSDTGFNALEKAILQWFVDTYDDDALTAQIKAAKFTDREWTKVGFYVALDVPHDLIPVDVARVNKKLAEKKKTEPHGSWPIDGPLLHSDDIEHQGGVLLWGKDGFIQTIEMYAYGDFFNEYVGAFKVI
jgi:hypothetical protein